MASQNVQYDRFEHVIRTSKQWTEAGIANWPVPRGVLCIELFPEGLTKLKVGEGDKYYRQLPYIGGEGGDLSNYYTKEQVDRIITNLKAVSIPSTQIYPTKESLPITGNKLGEIRFVNNPGYPDPITYLWNDSKWISIGGAFDVDLSAYVKRVEIMPTINRLENASHTHANKDILDQTTAPYTREEKTKLASLENYDDTEVKEDIEELQEKAHIHNNIDILNDTTASYTREEKEKLASLQNYEVFEGTDGLHAGTDGMVPAPYPADKDKFLSAEGTWKTVEGITIEPATTETLGGVIVGNGLSVNSQGVLWVTGSGEVPEYVAGDGISIDEGETTQDITSLAWEQGSIDPTTGTHDDTITNVIRSPEIETGLTQMLNVSAQATDSTDMVWKAVYYDSNHEFIQMDSTWHTLSGDSTRPENATYVILLLKKQNDSTIDENSLQYCEISWPIEIGKYVITNTGVTHLEMNGASLISVENGETSTIMEFSQDLEVTNGVVSIPDYHRLTLNVEV